MVEASVAIQNGAFRRLEDVEHGNAQANIRNHLIPHSIFSRLSYSDQ